jgi:hypothetical protein
MTLTRRSSAWTLGVAVFSVLACGAVKAEEPVNSGIATFSGELVRTGSYLLDPADRPAVDELNRRLREAKSQEKGSEQDRAKAAGEGAAAARELLRVLDRNQHVVRVSIEGEKIKPSHGASVILPGDAGVVLLRVSRGEGETRFLAMSNNMSENASPEAVVGVELAPAGITWALIALSGVPVRRSSLLVEFARDNTNLRLPIDVQTPEFGRLKVSILSEDNGRPTPAMVRLVWKTMGTERQPANAIEFGPQFDQQGDPGGRRRLRVPGYKNEYYWCVPDAIDMLVPPGEWEIGILHGAEHVGIRDSLTVKSGGLIERTYTPRRWVDMRKRGWYSGDDHVHCRIVSEDDARRLMAWVQAEDIHLANIVKMGDINRTWFEQRGWGKAYRVIEADTILSPGQECPRTHKQLGHTLSMNTQSMIRDTDRYYLYEEVADAVHAQGGLWGYAHVCSSKFNVDRDLSINVPKGKCDFVELMQFSTLGTGLYYDFLNTGFKVTASAGSDVPWGGSVGEVRVYAYTGEKPFTADAWFEAVRKGNTFTTNGPMIDFRVDDALPGDQILVKESRKLHVKARAWGDPERMVPAKLEIVRHGEVIRSADSSDPKNKELFVDFELDAGNGFWIAARVLANDGSAAHTTPVYVVREGLRFWKFDDLDSLLGKRLTSLDEVDQIVTDATKRNEAGALDADRTKQELALQGPELLKRVAAARQIYADLKQTAERERPLRTANK